MSNSEILFFTLLGLCVFGTLSVQAEETLSIPVLNPSLKFPTLEAYESECAEPGIIFDSTYVMLFAPKRKTKEAGIIFRYLVKAYDELYSIVGMHTEYKIVVYHFPQNNKNAFGGTSNCTIWYSYKNLDLASQKEWTQYKVPHVSGYIEEMAHNFVHSSKAHFGWEMIGWSIGTKVTMKIARNPIYVRNVQNTRRTQAETFKRYRQLGYVFPEDIAPNLCDRIHAHLLWICERKYGSKFWPDFFKEIKKDRENLLAAAKLGNADKIRNRKYQITIECFDRLDGLNFKEMLNKFRISLTTDIKALHPTKPGWDRKFIASAGSGGQADNSESVPKVNPEDLPPLHAAAYGAHEGKAKQLILDGADVNAKGPNGWTPLHMAAIGGHQLMAKFLLKQDANINARDKQAKTPAELARICGHDGLAKFLTGLEK